MSDDIETLHFEEAYTRLEQTLEDLRQDGLPLDRALDLYDKGTRLAARCDKLLADAELRVSTLTPAGDGGPARIVREETSVYVEESTEEW